MVQELTVAVTARLAEHAERLAAEPDYVTTIVRDLIVPHVDFPALAGAALAGHWGELSAGEQRCFTTGFRRHLVERYARVLIDYDYTRIETDPLAIGLADGPVYVTQTVTTPNPHPMSVRYELTPAGDTWKLTDLILVGISLVDSYRTEYAEAIDAQGIGDFLRTFPECRER